MLARLAYVVHLGSLLGGLGATLGAAQRREPAQLALAALLLTASLGLAWALRRTGWYARCRDSFASLGQEDEDPRLGRLMERRGELERLRGTPAFDPWALLAVQHEIDAHLRGEKPAVRPGVASSTIDESARGGPRR
jgi:hypothetical protein